MVQISRPLSAPIYSGLRISFSDHAVGLRVALLTATALPRVYQKEHPADALVLLSLSQSGLLRRPRCLDTIQVIPLWPVTSRRQKIDLDGSKRRTPPTLRSSREAHPTSTESPNTDVRGSKQHNLVQGVGVANVGLREHDRQTSWVMSPTQRSWVIGSREGCKITLQQRPLQKKTMIRLYNPLRVSQSDRRQRCGIPIHPS